jgi:hypothetical protein
VPLGDEQRREAVELLAELLIDAARTSTVVVSGGGFPGALDGASGGVAPLPNEGVRARRAA